MTRGAPPTLEYTTELCLFNISGYCYTTHNPRTKPRNSAVQPNCVNIWKLCAREAGELGSCIAGL